MEEMDNIQRKKRKKHQPVEVHSQSMETVMLATEQQEKNYRMLLEILSRLSVKSLLRFMCVCKNWKTLILSHPFRKLHREKHVSSPPLLIAAYNICDLDYSEIEDSYTYLITSDLEGKIFEKIIVPIPLEYFFMRTPPYQSKLLCFVSFHLKKVYLYNPSTRQSFLLTNPSSFSSPEFKVLYSVQLGYIPSKDEYIVVHLIKAGDKLFCEVLSNISISNDNFKLHYNQWRSYSYEFTTMIHNMVVFRGVFVGGAFYWIVQLDRNRRDLIILSFDVDTGCFSTVGLPQHDEALSYATLMELDGDLYLAHYPVSPAILTLWKWSSDNKLWTIYWVFDFERLFGFIRGYRNEESSFRSEIFMYRLKYLKGYDHQPSDHEVSDEMGDEMGELPLEDGWDEMPIQTLAATHTNLFTL